MSPDKLAYMANQIGKFFAHQPHDKAVASIADHLRKFWDPQDARHDPGASDAVKGSSIRWSAQAVEQLRKADQDRN